MATIKERKDSRGAKRYTAVIRIRKGGEVVHQENRTFSTRNNATEWASRRELELTDARRATRAPALPLRELLDWYLHTHPETHGSKRRHLEFLSRQSIVALNARTLRSEQLVDHIRTRRASGAGPATAQNELIWIGIVLHAAKRELDASLHPEVAEQARLECRQEHLIAHSAARNRHSTADELQRLSEHFASRDGRAEIPMHDLIWFAVHSKLRATDICRLEWDQLAVQTHPDINTEACRFNVVASEIIQRQPRTHRNIFPYNPKSIGIAFSRACKVLQIDRLRFDDLRWHFSSKPRER